MRVRRQEDFDADTRELTDRLGSLTQPLEDSADLDPLMERIGDSRYVLLGEASHGTSEFYTWRMRLSQRLMEEKGFSFICVEGDWPDCYRVNRYVKSYPHSGDSAFDVLHAFERWPTWMWANWEIVALAEWMRSFNQSRQAEMKVGFYGLDVYSLWESLDAISKYLEENEPDAVPMAREAYRCFEPYSEDPQEYARAVAFVPETCENEVVELLKNIRNQMPQFTHDHEFKFSLEQNALVVQDAERYYRAMIAGGGNSWNVRDYHMAETLDRLMAQHGDDAKAIVWAHNTHVGDARATNMSEVGMVNIGELARRRHRPDGVVLVGSGSYEGSVIAGQEWDAPMEVMDVPQGRPGSWERVFHDAKAENQLLIMNEVADSERFLEIRGHRAIGVVYDPEFEAYGNYVPTVLPRRYDAFLFVDKTVALHPLHMVEVAPNQPPDLYPWGF